MAAFKLIVTVRRGSACNLDGVFRAYPTLEAARTQAEALLRHERVARIAIARDEVPPVFVEWVER